MICDIDLPDHLFISDDGCLVDTREGRNVAAGYGTVVRYFYRYHFAEPTTVPRLKATLRAGGYVWPGGYPLMFYMQDGATLAFETVRKEFKRVLEGMRDGEPEWTPAFCTVNYEGDLYDDHTGERIESAY